MAVGGRAGQIVEQQHRATAAGEVLLERQHLAAIAQRALGEQANLRQRIEHQPLRFDAGAEVDHRLGRLGQLHLRGMEQRVLVVAAQRIGGRQLEQLDPLEGPAVRRRDHLELFPGLGQRDVDAPLAAPVPFQQELQGQRRLADPGSPSINSNRPVGKPPRKISSSPATPVAANEGFASLLITQGYDRLSCCLPPHRRQTSVAPPCRRRASRRHAAGDCPEKRGASCRVRRLAGIAGCAAMNRLSWARRSRRADRSAARCTRSPCGTGRTSTRSAMHRTGRSRRQANRCRWIGRVRSRSLRTGKCPIDRGAAGKRPCSNPAENRRRWFDRDHRRKGRRWCTGCRPHRCPAWACCDTSRVLGVAGVAGRAVEVATTAAPRGAGRRGGERVVADVRAGAGQIGGGRAVQQTDLAIARDRVRGADPRRRLFANAVQVPGRDRARARSAFAAGAAELTRNTRSGGGQGRRRATN